MYFKITAGERKNRTIKQAKGIRHTQNKVRAAIFNILGNEIKGAKFVDLFAGSGSVGIEALSRGARYCLFVEKSKPIAKIIYKNLEKLNYLDKAKILIKDATKIKLDDYDIVFADPPYNKGYMDKLAKLNNGILIIEHSKHEKINNINNDRIVEHYKYGDTILTVIRKISEKVDRLGSTFKKTQSP